MGSNILNYPQNIDERRNKEEEKGSEEKNKKQKTIPAQNGGTPQSKMYRITPALQTSTSGP